MFSKTKLLAFLLIATGIVFAGEPQYVDDVGHKETALESGLIPHEGTSDLYTEETIIQAKTPSVDVPDIEYSREQLAFNLGNTRGFVKIKWKPESFYGRNINLLNNNVDEDSVFFSRSTLDVNFAFEYGKKCYGHEALEFYMTLRSKAVWGNPAASIGTADEEVRFAEAFLPAHRHTINRQFPWIREVWLRFNVNDALGLSFDNQHTFACGSFPFQLGRGIALGSAYAVNSGTLGFFSDNTIDQFAYGFDLCGEFIVDQLTYDLYGAILRNLGDSLRTNTERVYTHALGRRLDPERGPGHVDYVIAGRLSWVPVDTDDTLVSFEPYLMYNNVPEQRLEFIADSQAKLATVGLAGEFAVGEFEFGFDTAKNFGSQHILGWDRNRPRHHVARDAQYPAVQGGTLLVVNDRVLTAAPGTTPPPAKALFVPGSTTQRDIDAVPINSDNNGQPIPGTTLYNDLNRFRDPYRNKFKGWMFVVDAAYTFCCADLKLAAEGGVASGDEDPNRDLRDPNDSNVDGNYKGFIGLQEIYSGNRVKSVFLLGGVGRAPRPLSSPLQSTVIDPTPSTTSSFTNIAYVGTGLEWRPSGWQRYFLLKPNILAYWQQHHTKAFDIATAMTYPDKYARNYLGTEVNCFMDVQLLKDFNFFTVGSVFIPGSHYKDIKGKPLTAEQQRILERAIAAGLNTDSLPLLGTDVAWTINVGLEARF